MIKSSKSGFLLGHPVYTNVNVIVFGEELLPATSMEKVSESNNTWKRR